MSISLCSWKMEGLEVFFAFQQQKTIFSWWCFLFYHFRNYIGDQVDYISQNLDNIQFQLANHSMVLDNSLFYDVFGHEGVPPGQVKIWSF